MGKYESCECIQDPYETCSSLGDTYEHVDCTSCSTHDYPKAQKCCRPPPPRWFFYDLREYKGTNFFDVNDLGK